MNINNQWKTICIVGFSGAVSRYENRSAHGAVCLCQARRRPGGILMGRFVNSNGLHQEYGNPFALDADQLAHWQSLA